MMRIGAWLTLTGVSGLLGACTGEVILANAGGGGMGGTGGQSSSAHAGASGRQNAPIDVTGGAAPAAGGRPETGATTGSAGTSPVGVAGTGNGGSGGVTQPLGPVDAQQKADKLDVLFVVDNSIGMGQKQRLLAQSVAAFVSRLLNPRCVDAQGVPIATQPTSGAADCNPGTPPGVTGAARREFTPVTDLHLGAITTSLGAHGGYVCSMPTSPNDHVDDKALLLPSMRSGVASYQGSGFLAFDASGTNGVSDQSQLTSQLSDMIISAGQTGCGFEATLESMYRFLIDPSPPQDVTAIKPGNVTFTAPQGRNDVLLAQREAFLRPDSSVAIVILSDENDCSIIDAGAGWFVGSQGRMPRSTVACDVDENDPCCRSCALGETVPPPGCVALQDDAHCGNVPAGSSFAAWDLLHDSPNLRCFDQQRRFGFDLLNPIERYTTGLTNSEVYDWDGSLVPNPLFAARAGKGPRSNSLISLSVIVGAPWQDLASDDSRSSENLTFLSAAELDSAQRFPLWLGAGSSTKPTDPLMRESTDERTGTNPLTGEPLVSASSTNPQENSANGHEQNIPDLSDLQYACTFPLPAPEACAPTDPNCDCAPDKAGNATRVSAANSPLCQPPGGGPAGTTQYYGKGYPGLRQLRLARELGDRAAYGSICPKQTSDSARDSYGYVPALNALIDRIAVTLK
ncbi:MAG TPA: hypothetical protein VFK05_24335 [Polyangiaceae bacterium]|nr:hypothetical protein [Polyangiaceae bacterium]